MSLARILDHELFLGVIVTGIRFSRYDASHSGLESKGLWVLTTSELARFESKRDHAKRSMLSRGEFLGLLFSFLTHRVPFLLLVSGPNTCGARDPCCNCYKTFVFPFKVVW
ncbi:hypothetical protein F2Q69_00023813 [Brassica cretica]|uniref:Uncharacterized protein n=1 Tax=Brassica cretica TaxID=69181 RepID=A0A8S9QLU8_BRACR|nr:hypothetical protein F2Q69_00023813 [Brassica cretica]